MKPFSLVQVSDAHLSPEHAFPTENWNGSEVIDESHLHADHAGGRNGGRHFRAVIVSEKFAGLNRVRAQQLFYQSIEEWMGKEIHALRSSDQDHFVETWVEQWVGFARGLRDQATREDDAEQSPSAAVHRLRPKEGA